MYLLDGNNVMGQSIGWHRDKKGSRHRLLEELAGFIRAKKARLTVVFDGTPDNRFSDGSSYRGVKVFFSRPGSDADERIIEMVEAERNRKNLTVVTSDRKLADRVRVCGVRVMRAGEFRKILNEPSLTNTDEAKENEENEKVGEWLRYFGVSEEDE